MKNILSFARVPCAGGGQTTEEWEIGWDINRMPIRGKGKGRVCSAADQLSFRDPVDGAEQKTGSIAKVASGDQGWESSEKMNFVPAIQAWTKCRQVFMDDIESPSQHLGERRLPCRRE